MRHVHFTGPKEENVQIRMVFDYRACFFFCSYPNANAISIVNQLVHDISEFYTAQCLYSVTSRLVFFMMNKTSWTMATAHESATSSSLAGHKLLRLSIHHI